MVFSGLVMAWRFATCPTSRSPLLVNATTEGVVRVPSWLAMTVGCPPSITATTEFVVPRSMPIIFPMFCRTSLLFPVFVRLRMAQPMHFAALISTLLLLNISVSLSSMDAQVKTQILVAAAADLQPLQNQLVEGFAKSAGAKAV